MFNVVEEECKYETVWYQGNNNDDNNKNNNVINNDNNVINNDNNNKNNNVTVEGKRIFIKLWYLLYFLLERHYVYVCTATATAMNTNI